jgi:hypothetical protein
MAGRRAPLRPDISTIAANKITYIEAIRIASPIRSFCINGLTKKNNRRDTKEILSVGQLWTSPLSVHSFLHPSRKR